MREFWGSRRAYAYTAHVRIGVRVRIAEVALLLGGGHRSEVKVRVAVCREVLVNLDCVVEVLRLYSISTVHIHTIVDCSMLLCSDVFQSSQVSQSPLCVVSHLLQVFLTTTFV